MKHADRAGPVAGGPFGDRAAVAIVGDRLADVAREALEIARVESQSRPVLLVDLLGQGSALDDMVAHDDLHGVSDAARYGVSLGTVARQVPNADGLFLVTGGAESPLADDVLSDHLWGSWSDQCRRAGALLVVAAPADLASVGKAIDQLDGMVMVGDAAAPATHTPLIGRVPGARRVTATDAPAAPIPTAPEAVGEETPAPAMRVLKRTAIAFAITGVVAALWWANGLRENRAQAPERLVASGEPIVMPGDPVSNASTAGATGLTVGAMPWSVELASVNTLNGAMARVRQALDSLPVPTFAATQPGGGSLWYRLLAGAYATSDEADSLLKALRARGAVAPAAGRVVQVPLAWLLEENVLEEQLPVRLFGWRRQGLPAYALVDRNGTTRIYFGAFESESEARLLTPVLDSLNLYATLATRVGSIR